MRNRILPFIAACGMLSVLAGCEQANVYQDVDFRVTLDPSNTYQAGDPVRFNISGNPDNLLFYSGEDGHEYQYRDRYLTSAENVESVTLYLQIQHRAGLRNDGYTELEIYYNPDFDGLSGVEETDRPIVEGMSQTIAEGNVPEGWTRIPYDKPNPEQDVYDMFTVTFPDNNVIAEQFCLAFYWNPPQPESGPGASNITLDTFYVNGDLTVHFPGDVEMTYDLKSIMGTVFMLDTRFKTWSENELGTPYYLNDGNGTIRLDATQDIVFAGGPYLDNVSSPAENDGIPHYCNGWIFSAPRSFLNIEADSPEVVKNIQNYMDSYEYTFDEPGTYTVTFVGTNSGYLGESRQVREMVLNIVPEM